MPQHEGFPYPGTQDAPDGPGAFLALIKQIVEKQEALEQSITAAREGQTYIWANQGEREAQSDATEGATGFQTDNKIAYRRVAGGWAPWESAWINYAATLTNISVGAGAAVTQYKYVGGRVQFRYHFTFGTGFALSGPPLFTLPFPVRRPAPRYAILDGEGSLYDASTTAIAFTKARLDDVTDNRIVIGIYAGTFTNMNATTPWAWAVGDILAGEFWADPE